MQPLYPPSFLPQADSLHPTTDQDAPTVADFGDWETEYKTLLEKAAWVNFSHLGKVALSGPDHIPFFGGLTTNQVGNLSESRSLYSALLTPQGRYLWDFTLVHHAMAGTEQMLLLTEPDRVRELIQQIAFYKLRAKVSITDETHASALVGIIGPEADQAVGRLFPQLSLAESLLGASYTPEPGLRLWRDPRHRLFGWRLLIPVDRWPTMYERLSGVLPPAGFTAWEACRIHCGLPRGDHELTPHETLPLEAGLLEMNGVDFGKGCYLGQETTARTQHRATIKKRLFHVTGTVGAPWTRGTPIHQADGKEVGVITSSCPQIGAALALLRVAEWENRAREPLYAQGQPISVSKPSWAQWS